LAVLVSGSGGAQAPDDDAAAKRELECTAPAGATRFRVRLPNTARAIRQAQALTIVAIGSSSTEGVGASDPDGAYPARLAAALERRWPKLTVRVVNKGIGGEDARQMLARFDADVLSYRPQLVIWQAGSNYALRGRDAEAYGIILRKGISRLKSADADVILMDLQYAPQVLDKPIHIQIVDTMSALANDLKVAVFRRFAIMRHWVTNGRYTFDDIVTRDRLHMNDASYNCIGRLLADSVAAAAARPSPAIGAAGARGGFAPPKAPAR
jgi:lysophospholipase L1-like esterase